MLRPLTYACPLLGRKQIWRIPLWATAVFVIACVVYMWSYYGLVRTRLNTGYELNYLKIRWTRGARLLFNAHAPLRRIDLWRYGKPTYYVGGTGERIAGWEDAPPFSLDPPDSEQRPENR